MNLNRSELAKTGLLYVLENYYATYYSIMEHTGITRPSLYRIAAGKSAHRATLNKLIIHIFDVIEKTEKKKAKKHELASTFLD